jgi:hypothetical protein
MNSDTTSLDRLHDLVTPAPTPWWPPTWGWKLVMAATAILLLGALLKLIIRWQANRYRREALSLLETTPPEQLSELTKRVALTVWPRDEVASLTGARWLEFLDHSAAMDGFVRGPGKMIESIAFAPVSPENAAPVRDSVREWILKHRRETAP